MRKLISLGLATAMVASMAVSAFAADEKVDTGFVKNEVTTNENLKVNGTTEITDITTALNVKIGGREYKAVEAEDEKDAAIQVYAQMRKDNVKVDLYVEGAFSATVFEYQEETKLVLLDVQPTDVNVVTGGTKETGPAAPTENGWKTNLNQIFAHADGEKLVALVEDGDWNEKDGVRPGSSVYFMLQDDFKDVSDFKFDVSKGENAKQIKKVSVIEKRWGSDLVNLVNGNSVAGTSGRHAFVKVELAENMTDKEYKISFDFKVKVDAKDGVDIGGAHYAKGAVSKKWEEIGGTWVYNTPISGEEDLEYLAGKGGIMVKPVKNEENTVLWTDENRDLAQLTFTADSDVAKYFPKLSTKWPNATYAQLFNDQDAFVFDFVGNPAISSTSRAVLELFCPFIDDEDEYTIDPESVVIYQVADDATLAASTEVELAKAILDGRLIDVTDKFTAGENEDGDFVYTTKTRTLGTYIIAEKAPSEEAFDEAEGEANDEKPADETGKTNPGTGR